VRYPWVFLPICLAILVTTSGGCPYGPFGGPAYYPFYDDYFAPVVGPPVVGCGPGIYGGCYGNYPVYADPFWGGWGPVYDWGFWGSWW